MTIDTADQNHFAFGKNWQRYVDQYLTPERLELAVSSLRELVPRDISGETFLDLGSGSGLFSLAAHRLGAAKVVSMDLDDESVAATTHLRASVGDPDNWTVVQGSVLSEDLVSLVGSASIVYSWGVLHHTGDMWRAIRNASTTVLPGGLFVIAIYNRTTTMRFGSDHWLRVKRLHNRSPRPIQRLMEMGYQGIAIPHHAAAALKRGRNPLSVIRDYQPRGMDLRTDIIDWIGGYPYEYATAEELVSFGESECGLKSVKVVAQPSDSLALNEIVFARES